MTELIPSLLFLFSRIYSIKKVRDSVAALLPRITPRGAVTDRGLGDENNKERRPRKIVNHRRQTRRIRIESELENVRESRIEVKRDRPKLRKSESGRFMKEEQVGIGNNGNIGFNSAVFSDVDII